MKYIGFLYQTIFAYFTTYMYVCIRTLYRLQYAHEGRGYDQAEEPTVG